MSSDVCGKRVRIMVFGRGPFVGTVTSAYPFDDEYVVKVDGFGQVVTDFESLEVIEEV